MKIKGSLSFPGDKSISHRAVLLSSITDGVCKIKNLSTGKDVQSTLSCLNACGLKSVVNEKGLTIHPGNLVNPKSSLDCGNSGTTARLLTGLLAGQKIDATLDGDDSLSQRPMNRIITPLSLMGVDFSSEKNGYLPFSYKSESLKGITYAPPIASAQVKSAVLLAGLGADGKTTVIENSQTRNHTEIMLRHLGAGISTKDQSITIDPLSHKLQSFNMTIPGDPSTAAFFATSAALIPNSDLVLKNVLANPTRSGFFDALDKMAGGIECIEKWWENEEEVGNLRIFHQPLIPIKISGDSIPGIIDELPILAVLATQADGTTEVRDAEELRVKESDRIYAVCSNLKRMGANIEELDDGFIITGPTQLIGTEIETFNDHRIAMAFTIAGLISDGRISFDNESCMAISCPEFTTMFKQVIQ
tara:strand:+ start:3371 stop:4621 length:1251 start_codon:yes stop_codon:yes gene_type:complete